MNAFQLKLLMAALMVLDHLDHVPGLLPVEAASFLHALTRCVSPVFAYLAVEGFRYTHSRPRYLGRLFTAAVLMQAGDLLYNFLGQSRGLSMHNNIFLTLACGVALLCLLDTDRLPRPARWIGAALLFLASIFFTEGGIVLLPFMLLTARLAQHRRKLWIVSCLAFAALLLCLSFVPYPTLHETLLMLGFNSDFLFVLALPVLACYNGQRGPNTPFARWFFYLFYPAHLWVLGGIALLLG